MVNVENIINLNTTMRNKVNNSNTGYCTICTARCKAQNKTHNNKVKKPKSIPPQLVTTYRLFVEEFANTLPSVSVTKTTLNAALEYFDETESKKVCKNHRWDAGCFVSTFKSLREETLNSQNEDEATTIEPTPLNEQNQSSPASSPTDIRGEEEDYDFGGHDSFHTDNYEQHQQHIAERSSINCDTHILTAESDAELSNLEPPKKRLRTEDETFNVPRPYREDLLTAINKWTNLPKSTRYYDDILKFLNDLLVDYDHYKVDHIDIPPRECLWNGNITTKILIEHVQAAFLRGKSQKNFMFFKDISKEEKHVTNPGDLEQIPLQKFIDALLNFESSDPNSDIDHVLSSLWMIAVFSESTPLGTELETIIKLTYPEAFKDNKLKRLYVPLHYENGAIGHFIITVGGHVTDAHIDPSSLTGFTMLLLGEKLWVWFPPTEHNLKLCGKKVSDKGSVEQGIFFVNNWRLLEHKSWGYMSAGGHLDVPPNYIHGVISFSNSAIFGDMYANFEEHYQIAKHLIWFIKNELEHSQESDVSLHNKFKDQLKLDVENILDKWDVPGLCTFPREKCTASQKSKYSWLKMQ